MKRAIYILTVSLAVSVMGCAGLRPKPIFTSGKGDVSAVPSNPTKKPHKDADLTRIVENKEAFAGSADFLREKIMVEIENLLGVPYHYGGNTPRGMDCSGFIQYVFRRAVKIDLPRQVKDLYQYGRPVSPGDLQFGDLVFFRNISGSGVSHAGIYLGNHQFAHATISNGVIISDFNSSYYRDRFVGARRVLVK